MDRRSFVRMAVLAGSAGALAAGGFGILRPMFQPRAPDPGVEYFGARRVGGPAPRGVPYLPIALDAGGAFVGRFDAEVERAFTYCAAAPEKGSEDLLFYQEKEEHRVVTPWFADRFDHPARPEDFPDVGFAASVRWRGLPMILVKIGRDAPREREIAETNVRSLSRREMATFRREVMHEDFVAVSATCTHFCAVAGYNEAERLARPRDAWHKVFCTSHNATFEPREPLVYRYGDA